MMHKWIFLSASKGDARSVLILNVMLSNLDRAPEEIGDSALGISLELLDVAQLLLQRRPALLAFLPNFSLLVLVPLALPLVLLGPLEAPRDLQLDSFL